MHTVLTTSFSTFMIVCNYFAWTSYAEFNEVEVCPQ